LTPDAADALRELFRACTLVTPNLPELSVLAASTVATSPDSVAGQARSLLRAGAKAVLVKGGHAGGVEAIDLLFQPEQADQSFASPRLAATMRGTGCMLASAVAARLAFGDPLAAAITQAKAFVHGKFRET
jgi:hydroxymethylpyrimidine/phosphomethylpyrimidine kinase